MTSKVNPTAYHIFIGYDSREAHAYDVCAFSLKHHDLSNNVHIHKIEHREMRRLNLFNRNWLINSEGQYIDLVDGRPFSTEFSHTRFLVPHLARYGGISGWVLFCDCDFLFLESIDNLFKLTDDKYAAMCVQFNFQPEKNATKMDGVKQLPYRRKLWSSLVLYNISHPSNQVLTSDKVNKETGAYLHAFEWLQDNEIGRLPEKWNFIPGISKATKKEHPSAIHFSQGGPWFAAHKNTEFANEWNRMYSESWMTYKDRYM